jgi:hypothetical protein
MRSGEVAMAGRLGALHEPALNSLFGKPRLNTSERASMAQEIEIFLEAISIEI